MSTTAFDPTPARPSLAIDGPVASGKSTVGRLVAARLGYRFLDTGTMYRALTWAALRRGLDFGDGDALEALARSVRLEVTPADDGGSGDRLLLDGVDVTGHLRDLEVERWVSALSAVAGVRRVLVAAQRAMAAQGGVVMVGRDIGTVVLPDAPVKVYLEASVTERARRRHAEVDGPTEDEVQAELRRRDALDSERADSPLRAADDAVVIETDGMGIEAVVERIVALVGERGG